VVLCRILRRFSTRKGKAFTDFSNGRKVTGNNITPLNLSALTSARRVTQEDDDSNGDSLLSTALSLGTRKRRLVDKVWKVKRSKTPCQNSNKKMKTYYMADDPRYKVPDSSPDDNDNGKRKRTRSTVTIVMVVTRTCKVDLFVNDNEGRSNNKWPPRREQCGKE
jgi:hypothetical protein